MGLEIAEMTMEIEDAFGIEIPEDSDIEPLVSEVVDYVYFMIQSKDSRICYSSYCFYQLRSALCEISDIEKKQIRPSTKIQSVLPKEKDKEIYPALIRKLGELSKGFPEKSLRFTLNDDFKNPLSMLIGIFCAGVLSFTIPGLIPLLYGTPLFAAGLFLFYLSELVCGNRIISWPAYCLQKEYNTFADAARSMTTNLYRTGVIDTYTMYSKEYLNLKIKEIISEITCIPIEKISDDAHLVKDLNMG